MSNQHTACLAFIRKMAGYLKWRFRLPEELDELISSGYIGYCEAMERFDPSYGVKPETFAYHRVRGAILDASNRNGGLSRWMRKRALLGCAGYLADNAAAARMETGVLRTQMEKLIDDLPPPQRDIIRHYHFDELTLDEIGDIYGHQKSWACKNHAAAIRSLRAAMMRKQVAISTGTFRDNVVIG